MVKGKLIEENTNFLQTLRSATHLMATEENLDLVQIIWPNLIGGVAHNIPLLRHRGVVV
jgi:hypothetical protein